MKSKNPWYAINFLPEIDSNHYAVNSSLQLLRKERIATRNGAPVRMPQKILKAKGVTTPTVRMLGIDGKQRSYDVASLLAKAVALATPKKGKRITRAKAKNPNQGTLNLDLPSVTSLKLQPIAANADTVIAADVMNRVRALAGTMKRGDVILIAA